MVEIQEPSDLVVRFEFERGGYVLPESARFMDRGIDFGLTVFDLTPLTADDLEARVRCQPQRLRDLAAAVTKTSSSDPSTPTASASRRRISPRISPKRSSAPRRLLHRHRDRRPRAGRGGSTILSS